MPIFDTVSDEATVPDYIRAAREIMPLMENADTVFLRSQYAITFANILMTPGEFYRYVTGSLGEQTANVDKLMQSFRQNLALLVGKTWVESSNANAKNVVLETADSFLSLFAAGSYKKAQTSFCGLSHKLMVLIFGDLAKEPDYIDYALRIDPKLGLFCWFIETLEKRKPDAVAIPLELVRTELLIGVYFLASL
jgi:hypothetical protein